VTLNDLEGCNDRRRALSLQDELVVRYVTIKHIRIYMKYFSVATVGCVGRGCIVF